MKPFISRFQKKYASSSLAASSSESTIIFIPTCTWHTPTLFFIFNHCHGKKIELGTAEYKHSPVALEIWLVYNAMLPVKTLG